MALILPPNVKERGAIINIQPGYFDKGEPGSPFIVRGAAAIKNLDAGPVTLHFSDV